MNKITLRIREFNTLSVGGDAPKEYSLERNEDFSVPIFSNGNEDEGLYGYGKKAKVKGNCITISSRGNVGTIFYRKEDFIPIVRLIALKPDEKIIDVKYFYYLMKTIQTDGYGTSQQQITAPYLKKRKITFFENLCYQKKISSILSKYDEKIENNNLRIKILNDIIEEIYKERFVRLRFPGYENCEIENKIPKGWEIKRIKDFGEVVTGKTPSTKNDLYYGDDYLFVKTPDMHDNIFVIDTEEKLSTEGSNSQRKCLLPINSIMVSCIGTGGIVAINKKLGHTNQQINSVKLYDENKLYWLYMTLKGMKETIIMFGNTGATMTNLSKGKFEKLKLIKPTDEIIYMFQNKTKNLFEEVYKLQEINEKLIKLRDLLLPRLMSCKLVVK